MARLFEDKKFALRKQFCLAQEENEKKWGDEKNQDAIKVMKFFEQYVTEADPSYDDINTLLFIRFLNSTLHLRMLMFVRLSHPKIYAYYTEKIRNSKNGEMLTLLYYVFTYPDIQLLLENTEFNKENLFRWYVAQTIADPKTINRTGDTFRNTSEEQFRMCDDLFLKSLPQICADLDKVFSAMTNLSEKYPYLRKPFVELCLISKCDSYLLGSLLDNDWVWHLEESQTRAVINKIIESKSLDRFFAHLPNVFQRWPAEVTKIVSRIYFNEPNYFTGTFNSIGALTTAALELAITAPIVNWDIVVAQILQGFTLPLNKAVILFRRILTESTSPIRYLDLILFLLEKTRLDQTGAYKLLLDKICDVTPEPVQKIIQNLSDPELTMIVLKLLMQYEVDNDVKSEATSVKQIHWFLRVLIRKLNLPLIEYTDESKLPRHDRKVLKLALAGSQEIMIIRSQEEMIALAPQGSKYARIPQTFKADWYDRFSIRVQDSAFFVLAGKKLFHFDLATGKLLQMIDIGGESLPDANFIGDKLYLVSEDSISIYDPKTLSIEMQPVKIAGVIAKNVWLGGYGFVTRDSLHIFNGRNMFDFPLKLDFQLKYHLIADEKRFYLTQDKQILAYNFQGQLQWTLVCDNYSHKIRLSANETLQIKFNNRTIIVSRETGLLI